MPHISGVSNLMTFGYAAGHAIKKVGTGIAKAFNKLYNAAKGSHIPSRNTKSGNNNYTPLKNGLREVHNLDAKPQASTTAHDPRKEAERLGLNCKSLERKEFVPAWQYLNHFDDVLKLSPEYQREPLDHLTRAVKNLSESAAFEASRHIDNVIDKLPDLQGKKLGGLQAALLVKAPDRYDKLGIDDFNALLDRTLKLEPEHRNGPLNSLSKAIFKLDDAHTFSAYARFKDAYEALPHEHRNGLVGIYEAGLNGNRAEFNDWEATATDKVLKQMEERVGLLHDVKQRQGLADWYGLSRSGKWNVEWRVLHDHAVPDVHAGENINSTLEKYGLSDPLSHGDNEAGRRYRTINAVNNAALSSEQLLSDLESCKDYLEVATKYGVTESGTLKQMKEMANAFYQKSKEAPDTH